LLRIQAALRAKARSVCTAELGCRYAVHLSDCPKLAAAMERWATVMAEMTTQDRQGVRLDGGLRGGRFGEEGMRVFRPRADPIDTGWRARGGGVRSDGNQEVHVLAKEPAGDHEPRTRRRIMALVRASAGLLGMDADERPVGRPPSPAVAERDERVAKRLADDDRAGRTPRVTAAVREVLPDDLDEDFPKKRQATRRDGLPSEQLLREREAARRSHYRRRGSRPGHDDDPRSGPQLP
jgi:hypothetical protein